MSDPTFWSLCGSCSEPSCLYSLTLRPFAHLSGFELLTNPKNPPDSAWIVTFVFAPPPATAGTARAAAASREAAIAIVVLLISPPRIDFGSKLPPGRPFVEVLREDLGVEVWGSS